MPVAATGKSPPVPLINSFRTMPSQRPQIGTSDSFGAVLSRLRATIEAALPTYLEFSPDAPPRLREAMSYSLMAGGKRLRPILTLLATEALAGDEANALPAACAVEMVHTYSLIHDDLPAMDDDDLRRGRPTNHRQFDEATAILAGDALLTLAFEVIARYVSPGQAAADCVLELATAAGACGMVGGQMADLQAEHAGEATLRQLEHIHRRKTGALLSASLVLGGLAAHASAEMIEHLRNFGQCVGLAFQITDDLLDLHGDEAKMGKGVRKDSAKGKLTYPALLGAEVSRLQARQLVEQACAEISGLGEAGHWLERVARYTIERDH